MCGIVGLVQHARGDLAASLAPMSAALHHRGPDDSGAWFDIASRVGLGHRRLSILDLSPEGRQPMPSPSGRFIITFNGEIYNFAELKAALRDRYPFRGGSDTEVMLAAFEEWGIERSLERFVGMFAVAVWDQRDRTLTLARDRMGEKPLYYGWNRGAFLFASELGAIRAYPGFSGNFDRGAIGLLMRHGYIPAPLSLFTGIYKLPPGTFLTLREDDFDEQPARFTPSADTTNHSLHPTRFWSAQEAARRGIAERHRFDEPTALAELERLLTDAVKLQMVADVPLGAFLSGGIDSSLVVALMQSQSSVPIKTFSIGFHEPRYNEANHAAAVARHLGTAHTELYVTPEEAREVITRLPSIYSEPFADSSQIPTYLVAKLAREHVTVSLSGDGGDELFAGYPRYLWSNRLWKKVGAVPTTLRKLGAGAALAVPAPAWTTLHDLLRPLLPDSLSFRDLGSKIHRAATLADISSREELYLSLLSYIDEPSELILGAHIPPTEHLSKTLAQTTEAYFDYMMLCDQVTYLPDDILVKVDRAGMAVSLESRIPLLDHRVVEHAWRISPERKVIGETTKNPLRHILYKHVPREIIDRPKMGFGIPIDEWLRDDLRGWAEDLLSVETLTRDGIFNPKLVRRELDEHLSGRRNRSSLLWNVLTFQSWLEAHRGASAPSVESPAITACTS